MSTKIKTSLARKPGNTPTTEDSASSLAEVLLEVLDKVDYRGGRPIEYRESSAGGIVRINRDDGGRVYFRTPGQEASVRVESDRSKRLLSHDSRRKLERFLERNPIVLSFIEKNRIR